MPSDRHIVLLGLMGSGKTSVGRKVAERVGRQLIDGDAVLRERTGGMTAAEVADSEGIGALHDLEAEIAMAALDLEEPAVIGPAASVIEVDSVRDALPHHIVVWLTASPEYLAGRAVEKEHRPLLDEGDPVELFRKQMAAREPLAVAVADLVVDVEKLSYEEQTDAVTDLLR